MKLHELSPAKWSKHSKKRVGRGPGSGLGKTAGKGEKGQKSRSGYRSRPGFEGGQMPLVRRVPKRGFTNIFKVEYAVVNVGMLAKIGEAAAADGVIGPEALAAHGLVRSGRLVKVLGEGEVARAITVSAHKFSQSARAKIEAAGGRCEEL
jgi:large subunit ribosomal protein L15